MRRDRRDSRRPRPAPPHRRAADWPRNYRSRGAYSVLSWPLTVADLRVAVCHITLPSARRWRAIRWQFAILRASRQIHEQIPRRDVRHGYVGASWLWRGHDRRAGPGAWRRTTLRATRDDQHRLCVRHHGDGNDLWHWADFGMSHQPGGHAWRLGLGKNAERRSE